MLLICNWAYICQTLSRVTTSNSTCQKETNKAKPVYNYKIMDLNTCTLVKIFNLQL